MPEWIAIVVLGLVEGLTEFLPVSSTGHLIIAENLMHVQTWLNGPERELFNVVIQSGAVLAVLLVFTQRLRELVVGWRQSENQTYLLKLLVAFVITGIGGVLLKKAGLKLQEDAAPVAWATLIGGFVIFAIEYWVKGKPLGEELTWPIVCAVGVAQLMAAVFPGTSRSGITILFALALGLKRPLATEFSFLVGIPTLLAAGALEISMALHHGHVMAWDRVVLGGSVAALAAFISVKWLLRFVQSHTFNGFGWYRIGLGILILWLFR